MGRRTLEKRAKEVIVSQMEAVGGSITTEEVIELVRPHYQFDAYLAKERELRRKANQLMSQFKDENGIRVCFNCKDEQGVSKYVNIEQTKNLDDLRRVDAQISKKFDGLRASKKKIDKQKFDLSKQIQMDFINNKKATT